jgi:hypothetical protein
MVYTYQLLVKNLKIITLPDYQSFEYFPFPIRVSV